MSHHSWIGSVAVDNHVDGLVLTVQEQDLVAIPAQAPLSLSLAR
jgi:hypothetical protein